MFFQFRAYIIAFTKFCDGVRKVAIAVGIIRGEDNTLRAEDFSGMRQPFFIGLARHEAAFTAHIIAWRFWQGGQTMRAVRIMIVHAPHPVGKPGSADFQKDKLNSRIPFHDPAADQRHDADHQVKRHTDHVDIKIRVFKTFLTRAIETASDPMNAHRCAEIVGFAKKRFEIRIVEIPLPDRFP